MKRGTKGVKAKDIEMRVRTESVVLKEIKIGVEEEKQLKARRHPLRK